jgi:membrane protein DedA with SNARE-associated domain
VETILGPLDQTLQFMGTHASLWAYGILFVAAAAEMLFPPFPGDAVFLSGMVLAGGGALTWPLVFCVSFLGSLGGGWVLYEFGRWKGRSWFARPERKIFNPVTLARIDGLLARHGLGLIAISRFLPGIRSAVPLAAGVAHVPRRQVVLFLTLSIVSWNGLLAGVGFVFGRSWEAVTGFVMIYNRLVITVAILALIGWGLWIYKKTRTTNNTGGNL